MILNGYNITTAYGNTARLKISLDRDGGFSVHDKAILKIRKITGEQLYTKMLDISENAVFFTMDLKESQGIIFGDHFWDITIYMNAEIQGGEIVGADEVITPFVNAKFRIERQASREVD